MQLFEIMQFYIPSNYNPNSKLQPTVFPLRRHQLQNNNPGCRFQWMSFFWLTSRVWGPIKTIIHSGFEIVRDCKGETLSESCWWSLGAPSLSPPMNHCLHKYCILWHHTLDQPPDDITTETFFLYLYSCHCSPTICTSNTYTVQGHGKLGRRLSQRLTSELAACSVNQCTTNDHVNEDNELYTVLVQICWSRIVWPY